MLDLVFLAMFAVLPVLGWSIAQVKYHRRYLLHKRVQLTLGAVLLVTVSAFEIDMRDQWLARSGRRIAILERDRPELGRRLRWPCIFASPSRRRWPGWW